jgi:crotonobetainyl-CoA:carnitine CoA-transferase CaiB-like acyl-CoA transferase
MDSQTIINIAIALAGGFGGWILNSLSRSIIKIEDRIADMPLQYVTKDDYKADIAEIKGMLGRIFDRLDQKADK